MYNVTIALLFFRVSIISNVVPSRRNFRFVNRSEKVKLRVVLTPNLAAEFAIIFLLRFFSCYAFPKYAI